LDDIAVQRDNSHHGGDVLASDREFATFQELFDLIVALKVLYPRAYAKFLILLMLAQSR
jgi:hypothetical protein